MVSFIVPVYNGEKFIQRCIESVLAQTYADFELILINDGSTDNSGALCDAFQKKDSRVKVVHQKNGGVSKARNCGLDMARGEYIGFVDADDYIAPNTLKMAMNSLDSSDICMFDAVTVWNGGKTEQDTIPPLTSDCILSKAELKPELLLLMAGAVWRCIYRADLLKDIRFPEGIKFSEDRIFNICAMGKAKNIHYLKQGLYYRVVQDESAVRRYHEDYFEACLAAHRATQSALTITWQNEEYCHAYYSQFIWGAISAICNYCYKTSPLTRRQRIEKSRVLCNNEELRQVLTHSNDGGIWSKLMKYRAARLLVVLGTLNNIRRGR